MATWGPQAAYGFALNQAVKRLTGEAHDDLDAELASEIARLRRFFESRAITSGFAEFLESLEKIAVIVRHSRNFTERESPDEVGGEDVEYALMCLKCEDMPPVPAEWPLMPCLSCNSTQWLYPVQI